MDIAGQLMKMKILAFLDCNYTIPVGAYVAQVNPETYSQSYVLEYEHTQALGTSGKSARVTLKKPDKLNVELLFDATGVIEPGLGSALMISDELGVEADLKIFKEMMMSFDSRSHRPRFLILHWGTLLFKCVLSSLEVKYTLFRPNGVPIRAAVTAGFTGSTPDLLREAIEKFSSPDLTHAREVKQTDTLLSLCESIYHDSSLYIKVAEVNGLTNFRKLRAGSKVYFPPIEKHRT